LSATTTKALAVIVRGADLMPAGRPGVHHGPFKSDRGCMLYEIHYYDESKK